MANSIESNFPSYPYYSYIKSPPAMGMNGSGSDIQITSNFASLGDYGQLLISGGGKASVTGQPLGNKFFSNTGGQCCPTTSFSLSQNDNPTCASSLQVDRYIYTDNVAYNLDGLGQGLIDGVIEDIIALNPIGLIESLTEPAVPPCAKVTLKTIDVNNNNSTEENYVALSDINNIPAYDFTDNINPVKAANSSSDGFSNYKIKKKQKHVKKLPKDPLILLYFLLILIIALYILYKIIYK
jgi:hypothetical protein